MPSMPRGCVRCSDGTSCDKCEKEYEAYDKDTKKCGLLRGNSASSPAASCQAIRDAFEDKPDLRTDGTYWIDFDGTEERGVKVYCYLSSSKTGEAWTLIQSANVATCVPSTIWI